MEEDLLSRALHAALAPHALAQADHHHHADGLISKEKDKPHLDIVLNSDTIVLKGTGNDVEPALLSGHISLYLTEPMSLKEITLQFRGKARLPATSTEP
jgi:arrestin-related trafficking adapter 4/5/7